MSDSPEEQMAQYLEHLAADLRRGCFNKQPEVRRTADAVNHGGTTFGTVTHEIKLSFDTGRPIPVSEPPFWMKMMVRDWNALHAGSSDD